jgi:hypothetical protein
MSRTLARECCKICDASRRTRKSICSGIWYAGRAPRALFLHFCFFQVTNYGSMQVAYARCHLDWARKNLETWTEAKDEVDKIVAR